jgi:uncharacterized protein YndB with AHSA1/START domain
MNKTIYLKDPEQPRLTVERVFDAQLDMVWKAWTESKLLDEWWAPKPWKTETHSMHFSPGGQWIYTMNGPQGEKHWCKVEYHKISPNKSFEGIDGFCDENGVLDPTLPAMHWLVNFTPQSSSTRVIVHITFDSHEDLMKIVEMGFEEGFASAHDNLEELLAATVE